ncbi:MAG: hypothetical protein HN985_06200 [Planctomycetaceae bacterium]|nr:hypothetical protein [Planctomycetaceae bacterium]MBT6919301.1 hypothetical protein [Planctomycetaceae bacterium]
MQQVIQRLIGALQRSIDLLLNTPTGRMVGVGLLGLVILALLTRRVVRLFKKPSEVSLVDPLRVVDLTAEPLGKTSRVDLKVHNMPVRLGVVVLAPLGRIELPEDDELPSILDGLVPGLGAFIEIDTPIIRTWSNQVSVGGFANNLALHMQVENQDLTETPWCLVAGKTKRPDGLLLVTLALAAATQNRLGVVRLEDESQWMQAIQVNQSGS